MKTIRNIAVVLLFSGAALASSHREAPAIANDPAADNTDVYAFVTGTGATAKVNIVANWIPFEEPSSGPNFFKWSDDVQYQIHIARGPSSLADVVTYTFRFRTQTIPRNAPSTTAAPCATPGTAACVGGGKEFFSQLTGDLGGSPPGGGHIIQTYTVTKTTTGTGGTSTVVSPATAVAAPWRIGPRTQKTINAVGATNLVPNAFAGDGINPASGYSDAYAATFIATNTDASRVFAGPRDDGFYVDLGGVFDLAHLRPLAVAGDCRPANDGVAPGTPTCLKAQDGLAGYNVHSIALEIPIQQLTSDGAVPGTTASDANTLGVWASSNRKKVSILRANGSTASYGPWVQVSRLGLPLINEAVIGYQDKDKYNRTSPKDDVTNFGAYFLNPVIVPDAEAVGIYAAASITVNDSYRHNRTDILDVIGLATVGCTTYPTTKCHNITAIGDVLRLDLNLPSGFPNGRSLINTADTRMEGADVTDIELSLLLLKATGLKATGRQSVSDNVDYNDKNFLPAMPWLALPWDGYSEGHGRPTP